MWLNISSYIQFDDVAITSAGIRLRSQIETVTSKILLNASCFQLRMRYGILRIWRDRPPRVHAHVYHSFTRAFLATCMHLKCRCGRGSESAQNECPVAASAAIALPPRHDIQLCSLVSPLRSVCREAQPPPCVHASPYLDTRPHQRSRIVPLHRAVRRMIPYVISDRFIDELSPHATWTPPPDDDFFVSLISS